MYVILCQAVVWKGRGLPRSLRGLPLTLTTMVLGRPYRYGHVTEVFVDGQSCARAVKHYAMGRGSIEMVSCAEAVARRVGCVPLSRLSRLSVR